MSRLRELTDAILPWIANSGRFGDGVKFVKCVTDEGVSGEAQFASSVCFVVAVCESGQETIEKPLLVKYNIGDEAVRNWLKLDYQFRNEVYVYETVLSFLHGNNFKNEIFPKYFYGSASISEDPNRYIIVLEDLRPSEYRLCPQILDLDFAHCALAFRKLGAFHAMSFSAKKSKPEAFFEVVNGLTETRLFEDSREDCDYLYGSSSGRAAQPLLKRGEKIEEIQRFRAKLDDSLGYMKNLLAVQEPMGVICHGDFCRNNVLYKYDDGTLVDVKFFDLATSRYGSPMLDFCFFFFLNCPEDSRRLHREEYLNIYHESLSSAIPGLEVPSLDDFKEEFCKKAVYGFLLCSFFKPAMMDPVPFNPMQEVRKTMKERAERVVKNGGEKATEIISNMLRELIDLNCVL